jgi:hypothetical protein
MTPMHHYRGRLDDAQQALVRRMLQAGESVRHTAKSLELPYGQVRGYAEWLEAQTARTSNQLLDAPHGPAMLVIDIETTPNLVWTWGLWKQNAIDVEQYWYMLSFAYAWYDLRTDTIGPTDFVSIFQDPDFEPNTPEDHYVVSRMWTLLDQADIVIGQNSKSFDVKKFSARAIINQFLPPSPYQQVDTKRAASEVGRFTSNSLKHLARELNISLKEENRGFPLWHGCMAGDEQMWEEMEAYNRQDVIATAELYTRLRPWMTGANHPNLGLYIASEGMVCTRCGNKERDHDGEGFQYRGNRVTNASLYKSVRCNKCGAYSREYRRQPQRSPITRVDLRP